MSNTLDERLAALAAVPLENEPGECFAYSDSNGFLLRRIVAKVAGKPFHEHLVETQLEPLAMASTVVREGSTSGAMPDITHEVHGELVASHARVLGLAPGLSSCARDDVWRWQRGLVDGLEILSERTYATDDGSVVAQRWNGLRLWARSDPDGRGRRQGLPLRRWHRFGAQSRRVLSRPRPHGLVLLLEGAEDAPDRLARALARAVFDFPEPGVVDRPLTPELVELYRGSYQAGCNRIEIEAVGDRLAFVAVGREFGLLYQGGRHAFVADYDPDVRLTFEVQDDRVHGFVLDEAGLRITAVRVQQGSRE